MKLLWGISALIVCFYQASASTAGFTKCPLSQMKLIDHCAELHCEVIGSPIPEVQWWFIEGEAPNETLTQLFDGAREDRIRINATYIEHAASTIHLTNLTFEDSGTYECRASNDPDRNELKKTPRIKWIRSQANIIVMESEWPRKEDKTSVLTAWLLSLSISDVVKVQLLLHPLFHSLVQCPLHPPASPSAYSPLPLLQNSRPVVEKKPGHDNVARPLLRLSFLAYRQSPI